MEGLFSTPCSKGQIIMLHEELQNTPSRVPKSARGTLAAACPRVGSSYGYIDQSAQGVEHFVSREQATQRCSSSSAAIFISSAGNQSNNTSVRLTKSSPIFCAFLDFTIHPQALYLPRKSWVGRCPSELEQKTE